MEDSQSAGHSPQAMGEILDERIVDLRRSTKSTLTKLYNLLNEGQFDEERVGQVRSLVDHLDELFLLVIVGEYNAGKSTFINAILGEKVCKEGAVVTTDKVNVVRWGETPKERILDEHLVEFFHPFEKLKSIHIVDTPGTNSQVLEHAKITERFIPRCDLVLFATSVDRPFSESERKFLEVIAKGWAKKIVFVLTKVDIKEPEELDEILTYMRDSSKKAFDLEPTIFPVSAKQAFKAKQAKDEEAYRKSGFDKLEQFLFDQLNDTERLGLKLHSPLDASLKIVEATERDLDERLGNVKELRAARDTINDQLKKSEENLKDNVHRYLSDIDAVILEFEKRARNWIDEHVALTNFMKLRDSERFRQSFEAEVVRAYESEIQDILNKACDWMVKTHLSVGQDIMAYYEAAVERGIVKNMVGTVKRKIDYAREEMLDKVRNNTRDRLKTFDREQQVRRMQLNVSNALLATFGISIIGIGGGALAVILGTSIVDVSGIIGGVALLSAGLFVMPAKRRSLKKDFSQKVLELKRSINDSLRNQFEDEATKLIDGIREQLRPFIDFCDRELSTIRERQEELGNLRKELVLLKNRANDATKA